MHAVSIYTPAFRVQLVCNIPHYTGTRDAYICARVARAFLSVTSSRDAMQNYLPPAKARGNNASCR